MFLFLSTLSNALGIGPRQYMKASGLAPLSRIKRQSNWHIFQINHDGCNRLAIAQGDRPLFGLKYLRLWSIYCRYAWALPPFQKLATRTATVSCFRRFNTSKYPREKS